MSNLIRLLLGVSALSIAGMSMAATDAAPVTVPSAQPQTLVVRTEAGRIQGFTKAVLGSSRMTEVFLGVPYAEPPVGDRRFKEAVRPAAWNDIIDGSVMPQKCAQPSGGSEDCLYLNIYRPAGTTRGSNLPVMVYAHGGENVSGSMADFDGARFANQNGEIVVTVQYRLGALGFLNTPAQGAGAGNMGVDDITQALRWVRRNIERFGGHPYSIVLAGQDAGASNACRILVDKNAKGLLQGVILQSTDCMRDVVGEQESREKSQKFLRSVGCEGSNEEVMACLQSLSTQDIVKASRAIGRWSPTGSPAIDQIRRGNWNKAAVLMGANREEGRSAAQAFVGRNEKEYVDWVNDLTGVNARDVLKRYPAYKYEGKHAIAYVMGDVITDSGMRGLGGCGTLGLADAFERGGAPGLYFYEFQDSQAPTSSTVTDFKLLAAHGAELPYLWPDAAANRQAVGRMTENQWELGNMMRRYWGLFVRYKNPNQKKMPSWRGFVPSHSVMLLRADGTTQTVPVDEVSQSHKCSFWNSMRAITKHGN